MRRLTKLQAVFIAVALVAALGAAVLLVTRGDLWPDRHANGWGPLGSYGTAGMGFDAGRPGPWSIGVPICLARGSEPAVLDGTVAPATQIGNRFRLLGAVVRQGIPSKGFGVIGSVEGFPPTRPYDDTRPAKGFAVSTACDSSNLSVTRTELDVGLAPDGTDGGGWDGLEVGYSVGFRHHVLRIESIVAVCGFSVPRWLCGGPAS